MKIYHAAAEKSIAMCRELPAAQRRPSGHGARGAKDAPHAGKPNNTLIAWRYLAENRKDVQVLDFLKKRRYNSKH